MSVFVNTEPERQLLRSHRVGLGLLKAMWGEIYYGELAYRSELIHKVAISTTALLSTGAVIALFELLLPKTAPHLAVGSALVSVLGTAFAWRSQSLAFAKASKACADQAVHWRDIWEAVRVQKPIDDKRVTALELESNKISEQISPHRLDMRLARECQNRIRRQTGLG